MLTDNRVLVEKHRKLPAIMCVQRKAQKKVVTEEDAIEANIGSFGDDIGKTTNWITSMFEIQSRFPKDSEEYKVLDYRIMSGQLLQQNSIDKAKGIVAQPMPRAWYDRHSANKIEDPDTRRFYQGIVADRKPYFMRYIYPTLMRQYNTYIKNTNKNCLREFQLTMAELLALPEEELTDRQRDFIRYYFSRMPVGIGDCVMNRICRRFEEEFDGYIRKKNAFSPFDYTILKSGAVYTTRDYNAIARLYEQYVKRLENYMVYASYERVDQCEVVAAKNTLREECVRECAEICPNRSTLCDIILDVCYRRSSSKRFAWEVCGDELIQNLLSQNGMEIKYPAADPDGEIIFGGLRFSIKTKVIGGNEWEL